MQNNIQTRNFALIAGLILFMMGMISFVPTLNTTEGLPPISVNTSYGMFLDIFPLNIFNKVAMILFGCWGVGVYFSSAHSTHYSIIFSKTVFWVMGALAILGMIPQTNTLFGHWPLYGFEIITHGIFAIAGGYYGYYLTRDFSFHKNHHHPHGMHKV